MQIVIVQNKIQPYLNQTSSNYTKTNSLIINLEPKVSIFLSKIVAEHLTVQSLYLKWLWNKDLTSVLSFWLPRAQFLYLKWLETKILHQFWVNSLYSLLSFMLIGVCSLYNTRWLAETKELVISSWSKAGKFAWVLCHA